MMNTTCRCIIDHGSCEITLKIVLKNICFFKASKIYVATYYVGEFKVICLYISLLLKRKLKAEVRNIQQSNYNKNLKTNQMIIVYFLIGFIIDFYRGRHTQCDIVINYLYNMQND